MNRFDFSFSLALYSIALVVLGMIIALLIRSAADGWPRARSRWAYPMLFFCIGAILLVIVVEFWGFVRAFT